MLSEGTAFGGSCLNPVRGSGRSRPGVVAVIRILSGSGKETLEAFPR
jgi:hypothetical protein